jgi:ABC-type nitrate/sulfonate/bicarbonate transport system permease component
VWELARNVWNLPPYLLPSVLDVAAQAARQRDALLVNGATTAGEALAGLAVGVGGALILAVVGSTVDWFRRVMQPLVVAAQTFPVQALAPLLVLWLGYGIWPKVAVAALISFFPMVIVALDALARAHAKYEDLRSVFGVGRGRALLVFTLPAASVEILGMLKICATLSIIGAVVGEFVQPSGGLGAAIMFGRARLLTESVFVNLLALGVLGLLFYGGAAVVERRFSTLVRQYAWRLI